MISQEVIAYLKELYQQGVAIEELFRCMVERVALPDAIAYMTEIYKEYGAPTIAVETVTAAPVTTTTPANVYYSAVKQLLQYMSFNDTSENTLAHVNKVCSEYHISMNLFIRNTIILLERKGIRKLYDTPLVEAAVMHTVLQETLVNGYYNLRIIHQSSYE